MCVFFFLLQMVQTGLRLHTGYQDSERWGEGNIFFLLFCRVSSSFLQHYQCLGNPRQSTTAAATTRTVLTCNKQPSEFLTALASYSTQIQIPTEELSIPLPSCYILLLHPRGEVLALLLYIPSLRFRTSPAIIYLLIIALSPLILHSHFAPDQAPRLHQWHRHTDLTLNTTWSSGKAVISSRLPQSCSYPLSAKCHT